MSSTLIKTYNVRYTFFIWGNPVEKTEIGEVYAYDIYEARLRAIMFVDLMEGKLLEVWEA